MDALLRELTMRRRHVLALGMAGISAGVAPTLRAAAAHAPSSFIEELTWMELRDAVAAGARTVLVPTGGTEENGPHMAIGKHNWIVRHCAGAIARRLGTALVAPVLPFVPEGSFDPPAGNLALPGTIGLSDAAFGAVLRDVARSLALAGFRLVCFLGDHGQSQGVQRSVAAALTREWQASGVRVANLDRYYAANGQDEWLRSHGFTAAEIGTHAGLADTAELMAAAPDAVRRSRLSPKAWPAGPTGAQGDPTRATAAVGAVLLELKIAAAVGEVRALVAAGRG
jgi:creatinine amidohydrolase/Fe(II)-dependent formamide hydrolase-like protein